MIRIGPVTLETPLFLAPIAGYCDLAFRTICREFGGVGLACTDLLSPQGLLRGTATSLDLARTNDVDKPVGMQLYGSDPSIMAEGARWAVAHGATVVDINMGCPVDKVTKKDGGSKLLTDLTRAVEIAQACVRACEASSRGRVPLTCKMRLCWSDSDYAAGAACSPGLAVALADAGVAAVTVHGRTTEMKFSGAVKLDGIARVVDAVNGRIPVIGNGDVCEPEDALRMMAATGCAGVMIGRGALSTPWIFRDTWEVMSGRARPAAPDDAAIIEMMRKYFAMMREYRGERYAMVQMTRRIAWFSKRMGLRDDGVRHGVKPLKEAIRTSETAEQLLDALSRYERGELRGGIIEDAARESAVL